MREQGSITVFLALVLSLLVALVASCLTSVQMACSRVQILNGADIGLYSLFAQYDTTLLEKFHLFYIDGGYGQEELNMGKVYDTVEEYMNPVLKQNYQNLSLESGGITGYRLATDNRGDSFQHQVIAYMKETLGTQGVQLLLDKVKEESNQVENQQNIKENAQEGNGMEDYDNALSQAQPIPPEEENTENVVEEVAPEEPIENPIDIIRQIQEMGILQLVLINPQEASQKVTDVNSLVSNRQLEEGMGVFQGDTMETTATDRLLFQEYLLQTVGNYRNPVEQGLLSYPMEYIIGKNGSDTENLKEVANRLLVIREGINFVHLLGDGAKRSQATALATSLATALGIPVAAGIVEMVLLGCWAYGESILDVRELFAGGKVPLVKDAASWQLSLEKLPQLLGSLDTDRKTQENGMSYDDYLRVLLFLEGEDVQVMKGMDVFELTVRGEEGHENFRMDSCLDALEIQIDVKANGRKTYTVLRQYTY